MFFCVGLLAGMVGPAVSAQASVLTHHFVKYFGESMSHPEALAVDQTTGDVYIVETWNGCVSRYHGYGGAEPLSPDNFPANGTNKLCGFAFDSPSGAQVAIDNSGTSTEGTIYVTSPFGGGVQEYDIEGNFIGTLPSHGGSEQCGIATDSEGNVMDGTYYGGLEEFKHNDPVTSADWVHTTYGGPVCLVAFDGLEKNRYGSFWYNGPLIKTLPGEDYGFVFDEESTEPYIDPVTNDLYVNQGQTIAGFTEEGQLFEEFPSESSESRGVAIDHETGVLYASDTNNGRIGVFSSEAVYKLEAQVSGTGLGGVNADSGELSGCGEEGLCTAYYPQNATVVLTATPQPHSVVGAWTDCDSVSVSGTGCTVTLTSDRQVSATFTRLQQPLTVSVTGTGTGAVSAANGSGVIENCGESGVCSGSYDEGSVATLIPTPSGHSAFTGWSGACTNVSGPCEVAIEAATSVTAHFTAQHSISIDKAGTGAGAVESEPDGIACGGTCLAYFTDGEAIALSPIASGHSSFTGWSGAVCSGMGVCQVPIGNGSKTVIANFAHDPPGSTTEGGVTFLGQHAGTVHGSVNPNGAKVTRCVIEYGTTQGYGSEAPCVPSAVGGGSTAVPIGADLTALTPGTSYHFRVSATNVGGTTTGADQSFQTLVDTCDTNAALCFPPVRRKPTQVSCRKGSLPKKGRCVKKGHRKRKSHRHRGQGASK